MTNKPQTCYVVTHDSHNHDGYIKFRYGHSENVTELPDRYIFTKEELEERDREKHNFYLQETIRAKSEAEMYKKQYENFISPFQKEGTF